DPQHPRPAAAQPCPRRLDGPGPGVIDVPTSHRVVVLWTGFSSLVTVQTSAGRPTQARPTRFDDAHTRRNRDILATDGVALHHAPDVVDITCPGCGQPSIADLEPHEGPPELAWLGWLAERRLATDCPDHAHRVVVG